MLCLQEIKANPEQIAEKDQALFSPYETFWNPAERKGYSGTLTQVKELPVTLKKGLGIDRLDHEGRTIQAEFEDFTLFNLYVPNGWRLDYFLISEALLRNVKDVITHPEVLGSDHCPVTLILEPQ